MAFPTRIASAGFDYGYFGPFLSAAGNVYYLIADLADSSLHAYKATDPSSSFTDAASFVLTSTKDVKLGSVFQEGDVLHVATVSYNVLTSTDVRYHTFDMSSDTWTISNETVKAAFDMGINAPGIGITVRSDGDVIILYNGAKSTSMGSDFGKVKYARREAAVWTIDVAVDDAVAGTSWYSGASVAGSSDRAHFTLFNSTTNTQYERTLNSSNTLGTRTSLDTSAGNTNINDSFYHGVSYVSGANTVVWQAYRDQPAISICVASANSADTPSYSVSSDISGATNMSSHNIPLCLALDGTTVYCVFIEDTTNDIKYLSHPDGGSWSSVSALSTVDARSVAANIYTRGGNVVLAYTYQNGADGQLIYYNELTLSAADTFPFIVDMEMDFGSRRRRR